MNPAAAHRVDLASSYGPTWQAATATAIGTFEAEPLADALHFDPDATWILAEVTPDAYSGANIMEIDSSGRAMGRPTSSTYGRITVISRLTGRAKVTHGLYRWDTTNDFPPLPNGARQPGQDIDDLFNAGGLMLFPTNQNVRLMSRPAVAYRVPVDLAPYICGAVRELSHVPYERVLPWSASKVNSINPLVKVEAVGTQIGSGNVTLAEIESVVADHNVSTTAMISAWLLDQELLGKHMHAARVVGSLVERANDARTVLGVEYGLMYYMDAARTDHFSISDEDRANIDQVKKALRVWLHRAAMSSPGARDAMAIWTQMKDFD